ncbi:MAG: hypothetical protein KatS3mg060_2534 [Dehalococcoidia bacterium]|nr:MAG: hypothetical protein KatS3mg060_2534 [Dehalococcoidia bacterium]
MQLRTVIGLAAVVAAAVIGLRAIATGGEASSHREAPLISQDPAVDNVDTYVFRTLDAPGTVTFVATWYPFMEPTGGPNFYRFDPSARYNIHIDKDGDGVEDITYRWTYRNEIVNPNTFLYNTGPMTQIASSAYNIRQYYTVTEIISGPTPVTNVLFSNQLMIPENVGPRSNPNYAALRQQAIRTTTNGGDQIKEFTGPRDDPFFVDVGSIFDLAGLRPLNQFHLIKLPTAKGVDSTAGFNVLANVLQVPITRVVSTGCNLASITDTRCTIGVWSTAERRAIRTFSPGAVSDSGSWVQVSRLGMPLVNEVVIDLARKDAFNSLHPTQDVAAAGDRILTSELASLMPVLYPGAVVSTPVNNRLDLLAIFAQGLNLPALGIAGGYNNQQQLSAAKPSEQIRINLAVAPTAAVGQGKRLGIIDLDLAGFPNGRRLEDDVTDIALRAVAGVFYKLAVPTGPDYNVFPNNALTDGVDKNDKEFLTSFPYLADPWDGYYRVHQNQYQTSAATAFRNAAGW